MLFWPDFQIEILLENVKKSTLDQTRNISNDRDYEIFHQIAEAKRIFLGFEILKSNTMSLDLIGNTLIAAIAGHMFRLAHILNPPVPLYKGGTKYRMKWHKFSIHGNPLQKRLPVKTVFLEKRGQGDLLLSNFKGYSEHIYKISHKYVFQVAF